MIFIHVDKLSLSPLPVNTHLKIPIAFRSRWLYALFTVCCRRGPKLLYLAHLRTSKNPFTQHRACRIEAIGKATVFPLDCYRTSIGQPLRLAGVR